jgi:hypothetical protein
VEEAGIEGSRVDILLLLLADAKVVLKILFLFDTEAVSVSKGATSLFGRFGCLGRIDSSCSVTFRVSSS